MAVATSFIDLQPDLLAILGLNIGDVTIEVIRGAIVQTPRSSFYNDVCEFMSST